jgi:hypothetical protein
MSKNWARVHAPSLVTTQFDYFSLVSLERLRNELSTIPLIALRICCGNSYRRSKLLLWTSLHLLDGYRCLVHGRYSGVESLHLATNSHPLIHGLTKSPVNCIAIGQVPGPMAGWVRNPERPRVNPATIGMIALQLSNRLEWEGLDDVLRKKIWMRLRESVK